MPGIIGKKIGMTSIFDEQGKNVPCTIIEAGPCVVTQIREKDKDGYDAVQLAYGEKREKSTTGAMLGHFKKAKTTPKTTLVEFEPFNDLSLGDTVKVEEVFEEGEFVDVAGKSKGKGFQGVVKRHGFAGVGGQTHGQHNRDRAPGSIGNASTPSRVFKGMRMAGRTGGDTVKIDNLRVIKIIPEQNLILVKGGLPGAKGTTVTITK